MLHLTYCVYVDAGFKAEEALGCRFDYCINLVVKKMMNVGFT